MPSTINHRRTNIVTLEQDESISDHCREGDIAIVPADDGWWTHFVGENGHTDTYDAPFKTYNEALWTAKAAAEFSSAGE